MSSIANGSDRGPSSTDCWDNWSSDGGNLSSTEADDVDGCGSSSATWTVLVDGQVVADSFMFGSLLESCLALVASALVAVSLNCAGVSVGLTDVSELASLKQSDSHVIHIYFLKKMKKKKCNAYPNILAPALFRKDLNGDNMFGARMWNFNCFGLGSHAQPSVR